MTQVFIRGHFYPVEEAMAERKKSTKKAVPKKKAPTPKAEAGVVWVDTTPYHPSVFTVKPTINKDQRCDECNRFTVGTLRRSMKDSFQEDLCEEFIELCLPGLKDKEGGLYKVKLNAEILEEVLPKDHK
jgi:hypothetical protein